MRPASPSPPSQPERGHRRGVLDRLAGRLALAGASLGLLAGPLELAIGPSIREWVGNKQDTTRLGLATIVLAAVALAGAVALHRGRHTAIVAAHESHRTAYALLALGTLPFALSTWWSIVTPLIAVLALTIGGVAVRQTRPEVDQ